MIMAALLIPATQMNGTPVFISVHGIKMIEGTTFTPEHVEAKAPVAKEGEVTPETTQTMEVAPVVAPTPITCTKITFHDDKTLVVKELVTSLAALTV
jgi:hypothetical protein